MERENNTQHDSMSENEVIKDRSLRYMAIGLGIIILVMGYLTLYVDDASSFFSSKREEVVTVIDDNNSDVLVENSSMSDEQVRSSLIKFIEAFYNDQRKGYFDPPSYFSPITRTYYNYHNLTYKRLKEVHAKRMSDLRNYNLTWIVSSLDYDRNNNELLASYWAKVSYVQPSRNAEVSGDIKFELAVNEEGKIMSLREAEIKNLVVTSLNSYPDSIINNEIDYSQASTVPEKIAEPLPEPLENPNSEARYEGKLYDLASVELAPEFQGGQAALGKYLGSRLRYPAGARQNKIQGKVYIGFIVEKNGSLADFKVVRGIGGGCDEEAIRVLRSSPAWRPGMANGKPVRTSYVLPITFMLGN
ncbi:energy transducer TonB [Daejeonella sp.]|uniref:energy transducer TonB n=1 Tax=Daejeonella sp. TaxID=2805397 RepID=UPI0027306084|nr:energy transducer TonB [Daejeonella sp.]MDP2414000.1 energy transducer TonB [Daejeonella sp.]